MKLRIATFNVENLFSRARILSLKDPEEIDRLLGIFKQVQKLISSPTYDKELKDKVFELTIDLLRYIDFRKDAGSLGDWKKEDRNGGEVTGFRINQGCKGRGDWTGEIIFKRQEFGEIQRENTGRVIKALDADILCAVEVEGMDVLKAFNNQVLKTKKFKQFVMIDSPNDPRGIDVACLTRHKILSLRTHVFDAGKVFDPVFSRDCLEVALDVGLAQPVYVLCNHFKSQNGKTPKEKQDAADKRKDQAGTVAQILLQTYNLKKDYIVVMGDLNEDSSNAYQSLKPLFDVKDLYPVIDPASGIRERYSYHFGGGKKGERLNQLDYIFLSAPLHEAVRSFGFERRGIAGIEKITSDEGVPLQKSFPEVTTWDTGASDHAGLWVELDI